MGAQRRNDPSLISIAGCISLAIVSKKRSTFLNCARARFAFGHVSFWFLCIIMPLIVQTCIELCVSKRVAYIKIGSQILFLAIVKKSSLSLYQNSVISVPHITRCI
ncbi:hypothetical protein B0T26DRAFT_695681 [Lasiosphaeria miniovina]|uniref:Uncharacterized protein n=1 Tax=Lasiosphaeria miniovina TaxID=1954250 RepID=A0AA40E9X6_9PEZI|nr:uncharacterized protein B0T26DRAFT_695681 [Lasiosphaeria miniovina]KAK0727773.1 hypothetical protein B0T26DRAFT_695681 [Lasiosphaeria miniovina]